MIVASKEIELADTVHVIDRVLLEKVVDMEGLAGL